MYGPLILRFSSCHNTVSFRQQRMHDCSRKIMHCSKVYNKSRDVVPNDQNRPVSLPLTEGKVVRTQNANALRFAERLVIDPTQQGAGA